MTRVDNFLRPRWTQIVHKPVTHAHRGVIITRNAIYCCTVAGISISNSKLGDLKRQIDDLLDDDGGMAEERARHP
jgi:hypothetical protein